MLVVGLTGGMGAGKSAVADLLVGRGAVLVDADQIARDVVEPGAPAYGPLIEHFGPGIVAADGTIDRPALAKLAFADTSSRQQLNALTHPAIGAGLLAARDAHEGTDAVVVMAIPLLTDTHRDTLGLDVVVVVDCPTEVALGRLVTQRGFSREDAAARIRSQLSREERLAQADYVVDNSGDQADLAESVAELWRWLGAGRFRTPSG
jgi:dephospho-CoA kinase